MKNRKRSLPMLLAALAAVSLGTVGFSTWLFNYEKMTSEFGTQVSCSEAYAQTAVFKVKMAAKLIEEELQKQNFNKRVLKANGADTIDNTIHLGENIELPAPDDTVFGIYADEGETDLTITIDATVELSKAYIENIGLPTSIKYSYASKNLNFFETSNNLVSRKPIDQAKTSWNYLDLPVDTPIDVEGYKSLILALDDTSNNSLTTTGGWKVTKLIGKPLYDINKVCTLSFSWGDYFNHQTPATYYNALLTRMKTEAGNKGLSKESVYTFFDNVSSELKTMYQKCNIKTTKENKAALSLVATVELPK